MKVKWIIVAVAAIAAGAAIAVLVWKSKQTVKKKRNAVQRQCAGLLTSGETILVNVLCFNEPEATALTIASLFNCASCPLRVYVAVYEVYENARTTQVVDAYASECKASTNTVFCLKDHIRVLRVPASEQRGVLVAMDQLERHLQRSETYTCTLMPGARLCQGWDDLCIAARRSAGVEKAVLTAVLPTADNFAKVGSSIPGTFSAWNTDLSLIALQMKKQTLHGLAVPALAWSSCFSFTTTANAKSLPYASIAIPDSAAKGWCTWSHDFIQNVRLASHGFKLLHPRFAVGTMVLCDTSSVSPSSLAWKQNVFSKGIAMLSVAGAGRLGWRLTEGGTQVLVTARGQLGLCNANDTEEVEVKLGSMGEIYSLQARLELPTK